MVRTRKINYKYETYKLRKHTKVLNDIIKKLNNQTKVMHDNMIFLKKYAEEQGTKTFEYKKERIKLLEKIKELETELKNLKELRKSERKTVKRKPVKSASNTRRK